MAQIGFSTWFPEHFYMASSYIRKLKILKALVTLLSVYRKKLFKHTNDCCCRMTSPHVKTIKEICSRWYRSQFIKTEKSWVRFEILCLDFLKIGSNKYRVNSRKVTPFENCEIFSNYVSYVRHYKAILSDGN